jgi:hypothetical protein
MCTITVGATAVNVTARFAAQNAGPGTGTPSAPGQTTAAPAPAAPAPQAPAPQAPTTAPPTTQAAPATPGSAASLGFHLVHGGGAVEFDWSAAQGATGYRVVWTDTTTGNVVPSTGSTTPRSTSIQTLSGTRTYLVRVTPYNDAGDGPELSATHTVAGPPA